MHKYFQQKIKFYTGFICIIIFFACKQTDDQPTEAQPKSNFQYTNNIMVLASAPSTDTISNKQTYQPPAGMVYIPGGYVHLGSEEGLEEETPRIWANVQPFFMDETEVTVAQFRKFVEATNYKTEAQKFGNSGVFVNDADSWWKMKDGAYWEYPQGADGPKAKDDHPVTQVSWNDATAYAKWAGKRLPSEIEWEHAARNASNSQTRYSWGEEAKENNKWKLNFFQGTFPEKNINEDGYLYTAPVGSFGRSSLGLADISGNVWEWCADDKINYADLVEGNLNKKNAGEKAMRGGSFLCETSRCHGYRVSSRSFTSPETSLMHIGFRCVKDVN